MDGLTFVLTEDQGPVRHLTLNQPGRKNAVPAEGWDQIATALEEFAQSDQRVLVVRGAGDDFCSGADLNLDDLDELRSPAVGRRYMERPGRAATALHRLAKPTIAAVDGVAVGAGMNLALGCDIVVATTRARFAEIFVKRGLTLDFGGTWLLPRLVGMARARELALTGRVVEAGEALQLGLACRVVDPDDLEETVSQLANELAEGAPLAQRFIKTGLSRSLGMTFEQAIAYEDQSQATLLASDDLREGVAAFMERRPPEFNGR
ncbi:MAG: enoyl-CoA hydratase-related protein [Acidimicrobiia bacterium]|nr:enoyl-CoA hydratase-related protein [Acidimicrobiia bacterium]